MRVDEGNRIAVEIADADQDDHLDDLRRREYETDDAGIRGLLCICPHQ